MMLILLKALAKKIKLKRIVYFVSMRPIERGDFQKRDFWFENDIDVLSGLSAWRYEDYTKNFSMTMMKIH